MMKLTAPLLVISSVKDGHMGVASESNRRKFFAKIGVTAGNVINMHLSHGNKVISVTGKDGGKVFESTDGLITRSRDIYLGLLAADCLPISFFDPIANSIGLIHAGWRGLENGIIENGVREMFRKFGTKPKDLTVFIGPHICQKHYEVKDGVSVKFSKYPKALKIKYGKIYLDLAEVAKQQLERLGVKNITVDGTCTFENKNFFSYRRDGTKDRNLYLLTTSSVNDDT